MLNLLKKGVIAVLTMAFVQANAQQDPQFTQFTHNQILYNPAYAGSIGRPDNSMFQVAMYHRSQWTGSLPRENGMGYQPPVTQTLTLNRPLAVDEEHIERVGGLLTIMNDQIGYLTQRAVNVGASYHVSLHDNSYTKYEYKNLYFGLSFGLRQYGVDFGQLTPKQVGDPVLAEGVQTTFTPDIGFGVLFKTDGYYFGASVPHLLETPIAFNQQGATGKQSRHYYVTGGITLNRAKKFTINPNVFGQYVAGAPFQFSANVIGEYFEMFWVGAAYRMDDAVGLMAGFNLAGVFSDEWANKGGKMLLGYSVDYNISGIPSVNVYSHEVMLTMNFSLEKNRGAKFSSDR